MSEGEGIEVKIDTNSLKRDEIRPDSEIVDILENTELDIGLIAGFSHYQNDPEIVKRSEIKGIAVPIQSVSNKEAFYGHPLKSRDEKRGVYCPTNFLREEMQTLEKILSPIESLENDTEIIFISPIFRPIHSIDRMGCLCNDCWDELNEQKDTIQKTLQEILSDLPGASLEQIESLEVDPRIPKEKKKKLMKKLQKDVKDSRLQLIEELEDNFLSFYGKKQKNILDRLSKLKKNTSILFLDGEVIESKNGYLEAIGLKQEVLSQFSNVYMNSKLKKSINISNSELDIPVEMSLINDSSNLAVKIARWQPETIYLAPNDSGELKYVLNMIETWGYMEG